MKPLKHQENGRAGMRAGWEVKTLGEVLEIRNGRNQREVESTDGEFPIYGSAGNVMGMATDYICEAGTTIIGRKGSINNPIFATTRFWNVDTAFGLSPKQGLDSRYLYYYCLSYDFSQHNRGTTIPSLVKSELLGIAIPLPPLAEQQRIVAILDEAFADIATARANAVKNLENARALFESHLEAVFINRGEGWVERRLEEVADADCSLSYGIVQPGEQFDKGMPIVRPTDLTTKVVHLSGLKRIDPKLAEGYKRTALQGGELLLCVRGSTGVVSIASPELVGANVTRGIVPIRFNRSFLLPEFGFYLIIGGPVQSQIREKTYGTALMQINIRDLRLILLSIPPLSEQKTITAQLDTLSDETNRLTDIYTQKIAALDALKKSFLHQAFSGAL